jgi:hypothetical protein
MNQIESLEFFNQKATVKTIAEIDYNDLDRLITDTLRVLINPNLTYYEMVAYEEWGNYQNHSFDYDEDDYDEEDWNDVKEKLKTGKWPHYQTGVILNYLVKMKYIPACELSVSVYW